LSRKPNGFPEDPLFSGAFKRFLQVLAYLAPGESSLRVWLHRLRGVQIGSGLHVGMATIIETAFPEWVSIGDRVTIGMRVTVIAHMLGLPPRQDGKEEKYASVRIEDEAFIGPGVIILPNVTIGRGAVVTAGSVVTRSVPPLTMVQGNPARPIGRCGIPLLWGTSVKEFYAKLRPL
jgi:acetyltransferase-like isoleucine patch superfamily enzyme